MQRRILALVVILALVALALPAGVFATGNTVTCTVSAETVVGVSVSPGNVTYGTLPYSVTKNTAQYHASNNPTGMVTPQTQTITNTGNVNEGFSVATSNAVGVTNWSLVDWVPGIDEFSHAYYVSTTAYNGTLTPNFAAWTAANTSVPVATGVAPAGTRYLELAVWMPSYSTDLGNHTITVTVLAYQS